MDDELKHLKPFIDIALVRLSAVLTTDMTGNRLLLNRQALAIAEDVIESWFSDRQHLFDFLVTHFDAVMESQIDTLHTGAPQDVREAILNALTYDVYYVLEERVDQHVREFDHVAADLEALANQGY